MKILKILFAVICIIAMLHIIVLIKTAPVQETQSVPEDYVFQYEDAEDRYWERELVAFRETYLTECLYFREEPTTLHTLEGSTTTEEFYDPELREWFIGEVDQLIGRIPELSEFDICYALKKILAQFGDAHAYLEIFSQEHYILRYQDFQTEDGYDIHLTRVPGGREELLFAKVLEFNGVPVEEVVEGLAEYSSYENSYGLRHCLFYSNEIEHIEGLEQLGIQDPEADTMTLTLELADGTVTTEVFEGLNEKELEQAKKVSRSVDPMDCPLERNKEYNYWFDYYAEDEMLYIRFRKMYAREDLSITDMTAQILECVSEYPEIRRIAVDFRRNNGGNSKLEGFDEFVEALDALDVPEKYVLIDGDSFSAAVMCAAQIELQVEETVLVGSPTAEPAYVHGGKTYSFWNMEYFVPRYTRIYIDDGSDALYPEVTVFQTIEDYREGVDTVFEYLRSR